MSHKFSLAAIVIVVVLGLFAACLGLWSFLRGARGMAALLVIVAETLENVRRTLPPDIAEYIPTTIEDLRWQITDILREHSRHVSAAGMAGVRTLVHVLFGMVIGGMTALHHFDPNDRWPPFVAALYARTGALADAFEKIVFAQVKISALNTVFSALYLMVILPIFGIHSTYGTGPCPSHICSRASARSRESYLKYGYCLDQSWRITRRGRGFTHLFSFDSQAGILLERTHYRRRSSSQGMGATLRHAGDGGCIRCSRVGSGSGSIRVD